MTLPELGEVTLDLFSFSVNPFSTKGLTLTNLRYILEASGLRYQSVASIDTENWHCPINKCSGTENETPTTVSLKIITVPTGPSLSSQHIKPVFHGTYSVLARLACMNFMPDVLNELISFFFLILLWGTQILCSQSTPFLGTHAPKDSTHKHWAHLLQWAGFQTSETLHSLCTSSWATWIFSPHWSLQISKHF